MNHSAKLLFLCALTCSFISTSTVMGGDTKGTVVDPAKGGAAREVQRKERDLKINWNQVDEVRRGVRHLRLEFDKPQLMKVNVIRVDLSLPGIWFTGTERAEGWGTPMPDYPKGIIRTKRERTADFMKRCRKSASEGGRGLDMIVASNTAPWSPWCKPWNHKYGNPTGLEISDGVVVSDNKQTRKAIFVVWKDGKMDVVDSIAKEDYDKVWLAHTGFGTVMKDGKRVPGEGYQFKLMPRMAIGVDKDRSYLYLLTIDGRQKEWSIGGFGADVSWIMEAAGAYDVVDFDGGGSATLCYWDAKENKPVMVNRHSASGYARPCGMNWGIYLKK